MSSWVLEARVVGGDGEFIGDGGDVDSDEVPGGDGGDGETMDDEGVAGDDGLRVTSGRARQHIGGPDSGLGGCWEWAAEEDGIPLDERVDERLVIDLDAGDVGRFVE